MDGFPYEIAWRKSRMENQPMADGIAMIAKFNTPNILFGFL